MSCDFLFLSTPGVVRQRLLIGWNVLTMRFNDGGQYIPDFIF